MKKSKGKGNKDRSKKNKKLFSYSTGKDDFIKSRNPYSAIKLAKRKAMEEQ
tara:strand:- start:1232 stop:1384 length:153 start_codon:yes stop_codon:yes gene_type:complete